MPTRVKEVLLAGKSRPIRTFLGCQGFEDSSSMPVAGRSRIASGRPGLASYLRQLARLNQIDEHVPLVRRQDRQIAGLTNLHLRPSEFHFRARAAPGRAQEDLTILHSAHLLSFTSVSRSM